MTERPGIKVFPSTGELVKAAAEEMIGTINRAIGERGECFVALSGGETPRTAYRILGSAPLKNLVEWDYVHFFFGDERAVPPDSPQSNFGMVNLELFSRISIPPENIHRISGEKEALAASEEYERKLRHFSGDGGLRFDLVLLGLGEDGHTASLFPRTDAVTAKGFLVRPVFVPRFDAWRITLTLECINNARRAMFLVAGKPKAVMARRILAGGRPDPEMPASLVSLQEGEILWMLDREAASLLG
jgi:6-phosphogluconolactonase